MVDLKQCPFCGSMLIMTDVSDYIATVYCCECHAKIEVPNYESLGASNEELDKAIAGWNRRTPQWISVEEQMPEPGKQVLAYIPLRDSEGGYQQIRMVCKREISGESHWNGVCEPTHWMPLPEGPREVVL